MNFLSKAYLRVIKGTNVRGQGLFGYAFVGCSSLTCGIHSIYGGLERYRMVLGPSEDFAGKDKILVMVTDNESAHIKLIFSSQLRDRGILG